MPTSVKYSPPYSMVVVSEPGNADIADLPDGSIIVATDSCITIGCQAEDDGSTEFTLGLTEEVDSGTPPNFSKILPTSTKTIAIRTAHNDIIMSIVVEADEIKVSIWLNDDSEPNKIVVGIGKI